MARIGSLVLGAGMVVLWIVGLNHGATMWLTWLIGIVSLSSIVVATMLPARAGNERAAPAAAVGLVLLALGLLGLVVQATSWLAWWTCAFACAHLTIAALEARQSSQLHRRAA
jgi:uncharacterized membrane protein